MFNLTLAGRLRHDVHRPPRYASNEFIDEGYGKSIKTSSSERRGGGDTNRKASWHLNETRNEMKDDAPYDWDVASEFTVMKKLIARLFNRSSKISAFNVCAIVGAATGAVA